MKNNLFRQCACASTVLFFGFVGLYAYVWITDPNPKVSGDSSDWRSVSIGHGKISIAHSWQHSTHTNGPAMGLIAEDGGGNLHITVSKLFFRAELLFLNQNMPEEGFMNFVKPGDGKTKSIYFNHYGVEFYSFEHTTNFWGFSKNDRQTESRFIGYGIYFRDTSHTVDKAHNWWTLMISLLYPIIIFGILPFIAAVRKIHCFWQQKIPLKDKTLISLTWISTILFVGFAGFFFYAWFFAPDLIVLWCLIILIFGILPAIFAVKKLRGRKSASTKNTTIEK